MRYRSIVYLASLLLSFQHSAVKAQVWDDRFFLPGLVASNVRLYAAADGEVYATGLNWLNGEHLSPVAKRDGSTWHALGLEGWHRTICQWRGELYAGGSTRDADGVYHRGVFIFRGNRWDLILPANDEVRALLPTDSGLLVGGLFDSLNGQSARWLALWNGSEVTELGKGLAAVGSWEDGISRLWFTNNSYYASGSFTYGDSVRSRFVIQIDLQARSLLPLGTGTATPIKDMVWWRGELYVTGPFNEAGGSGAFALARWDGSRWRQVGAARDLVSGSPEGFVVYKGDLVLFGDLDAAGKLPVHTLAVWNGSSWSSKYDLPNRRISNVIALGDTLFAYGDSVGHHAGFHANAGDGWRFIMHPVKPSLALRSTRPMEEGYVTSLAPVDDGMLAIGSFVALGPGGDTIRNFARFDGNNWNPVFDTLESGTVLRRTAHLLFAIDRSSVYKWNGQRFDHFYTPRYYGVSDVVYHRGHVYVSISLSWEDPSDARLIVLDTLGRLVDYFINKSINRLCASGKRVFMIRGNGIYSWDGSLDIKHVSLTESERADDIYAERDTLYVIGQFKNPDGFLAVVDLKTNHVAYIKSPSPTYWSFTGRLSKVGNRVYMFGDLSRSSSLAYLESGMLTYLPYAVSVPSYSATFSYWDNALYLGSTRSVDTLQSSGMARLILSGSATVKELPELLFGSVYPNPATDRFSVPRGATVQAITSSVGVPVHHFSAQDNEIQFDRIASGIYLITYTLDGAQYQAKLVISR